MPPASTPPARLRALAPVSTAVAFVLSVLAAAFALVALRSPRWSSQDYYFALNGQSDGTGQLSPLCHATRSPFYRCGVPQVAVNGTCSIPDCHWYKPHGRQSTSCRSWTELGIGDNDLVGAKGLFGSAQECQQVHLAGNLQIAASVFLTLALVMLVAMNAIVVLRSASKSTDEAKTAAEAERDGRPSVLMPPADRPSGSISLCATAALRLLLYVGAVLQILAQVFGVLAFVLNATPDGADATASQHKKLLNNFAAHEWVMDKALTTYATIAWVSAVLCAAVVSPLLRSLHPGLGR